MTATVASPDPVQERQAAYNALIRRDAGLARPAARAGTPDPSCWGVLEGAADGTWFAELALHNVSQRISTTAALTIFGRLRDRLGGTAGPAPSLAAPAGDLRAAGLPGAKVRSPRDLGELVLDGRLSFHRLAVSDDITAQAELEEVRGVGPWPAPVFLLPTLRRPYVFPAADTGLQRAAQSASGLARRPTAAELAVRAERWHPYRSYAAAMLRAHGTNHLHHGA